MSGQFCAVAYHITPAYGTVSASSSQSVFVHFTLLFCCIFSLRCCVAVSTISFVERFVFEMCRVERKTRLSIHSRLIQDRYPLNDHPSSTSSAGLTDHFTAVISKALTMAQQISLYRITWRRALSLHKPFRVRLSN